MDAQRQKQPTRDNPDSSARPPGKAGLPATLSAGSAVAAIVPTDLAGVKDLAQMVIDANMAPKGLDTPERATIAIMAGLEVGLKPLQALQGICVINNIPSLYGDVAVGLVQSSGLLESFEEYFEGKGEELTAVCKVKRAGVQGIVIGRFSVKQAKLARLWGKAGPWQLYPARMLKWRARSWAFRDAFADVLCGLPIAEEVQDYGPVHAGAADTVTVSAEDIRRQAAGQPPEVDPQPSDDVVDAEFEEVADPPENAAPRPDDPQAGAGTPAKTEAAAESDMDRIIAAFEGAADIDALQEAWDNDGPAIADLSKDDKAEVTAVYNAAMAAFDTTD